MKEKGPRTSGTSVSNDQQTSSPAQPVKPNTKKTRKFYFFYLFFIVYFSLSSHLSLRPSCHIQIFGKNKIPVINAFYSLLLSSYCAMKSLSGRRIDA